MTKLKYYVIELSTMPKVRTLAGDIESTEAEACGLGGGTCDQCGAKFITELLQDRFCPNCGTKRWNHITTDKALRLEDVHPWIMEKVKGSKTYQYWMASWREGDKVRNVHLGSCKKVDHETALQKARKMKAEALGMNSAPAPIESVCLDSTPVVPDSEPKPAHPVKRYVRSPQRQAKAMRFVYNELRAGKEPTIQDVMDRFEVELHIPLGLKNKHGKIYHTKKGMKLLEECYYCR